MASPGSLNDIQDELIMLGKKYKSNDVMKSLIQYQLEKFGDPNSQTSSEMMLLENIDKSSLLEKSIIKGFPDTSQSFTERYILTTKAQEILSGVMSEWLEARRVHCLFINKAQVFVDNKSNKVKIKIISLHKPIIPLSCNKADLDFLVKVIDQFDNQTINVNDRPVGFKHLRMVIDRYKRERRLTDMSGLFDHIALLSRASLCMLVENLCNNSHKVSVEAWNALAFNSCINVPKGTTFWKWESLLPNQQVNSKIYAVFEQTALDLEKLPECAHTLKCNTVFAIILLCRNMYNHLTPRENPEEVGRIIFTLFDETLCQVFFGLRVLEQDLMYSTIQDSGALLSFRH